MSCARAFYIAYRKYIEREWGGKSRRVAGTSMNEPPPHSVVSFGAWVLPRSSEERNCYDAFVATPAHKAWVENIHICVYLATATCRFNSSNYSIHENFSIFLAFKFHNALNVIVRFVNQNFLNFSRKKIEILNFVVTDHWQKIIFFIVSKFRMMSIDGKFNI